MNIRSARRPGFSMVELLTVIAIIGILAAILLPVFASVRRGMQESRCMNNMVQIHQAVAQYKDNWGVYPIVLDSYRVAGTTPGPVVSPLFPQYLKSEELFLCPVSWVRDPKDPGWVRPLKRSPNAAGTPLTFFGQPVEFRQRDSYDGGFVPNRPGSPYELHYATDWTQSTPPFQGFRDIKRQLKFRNPPADTVVTWCLNHADIDSSGNVSGNVLVLWANGKTEKIPGDRFSGSRWAWSGTPLAPQDGYVWLVKPKR